MKTKAKSKYISKVHQTTNEAENKQKTRIIGKTIKNRESVKKKKRKGKRNKFSISLNSPHTKPADPPTLFPTIPLKQNCQPY